MSDGMSQHDNHPVSFAELERQETVTPPEVMESFAEYAVKGWAISGDVVIDVAQRAQLKSRDLQNLAYLAYQGAVNQANGGRFGSSSDTAEKETLEYTSVLEFAQTKLAEIAQSN